jgi:hypothetical protein
MRNPSVDLLKPLFYKEAFSARPLFRDERLSTVLARITLRHLTPRPLPWTLRQLAIVKD